MIRVLERRKADEDEVGTFDNDEKFPFVAAAAGKLPGDLGVSGNAGIQLAALVLEVRSKVPLPGWLKEGFGRATVLHSGPAGPLAKERSKASVIVTKSSRTLDDILNSALKPDEQPYLCFSFVDYLAYSGRTTKFLPFIDGFRPDAKGNPGNVDTALKNADTTRVELTTNWQKYAKSFK
jgi:hypothetical protein